MSAANLARMPGSVDVGRSVFADPRDSLTRDEAKTIAASLHQTDSLRYGGIFNDFLAEHGEYRAEFDDYLINRVMEDYS